MDHSLINLLLEGNVMPETQSPGQAQRPVGSNS